MTIEGCEGGCRKCKLREISGALGLLRKRVAWKINEGLVSKRAGENWLKRKGGFSSEEQKTNDYKNALRSIAFDECEKIVQENNGKQEEQLMVDEVKF